jgi:hypothetical protein
MRRLDRLQRWGLIYRQGRRYYLHDRALNSFIGVRSYQTSRRLLSKATLSRAGQRIEIAANAPAIIDRIIVFS